MAIVGCLVGADSAVHCAYHLFRKVRSDAADNGAGGGGGDNEIKRVHQTTFRLGLMLFAVSFILTDKAFFTSDAVWLDVLCCSIAGCAGAQVACAAALLWSAHRGARRTPLRRKESSSSPQAPEDWDDGSSLEKGRTQQGPGPQSILLEQASGSRTALIHNKMPSFAMPVKSVQPADSTYSSTASRQKGRSLNQQSPPRRPRTAPSAAQSCGPRILEVDNAPPSDPEQGPDQRLYDAPTRYSVDGARSPYPPRPASALTIPAGGAASPSPRGVYSSMQTSRPVVYLAGIGELELSSESESEDSADVSPDDRYASQDESGLFEGGGGGSSIRNGRRSSTAGRTSLDKLTKTLHPPSSKRRERPLSSGSAGSTSSAVGRLGSAVWSSVVRKESEEAKAAKRARRRSKELRAMERELSKCSLDRERSLALRRAMVEQQAALSSNTGVHVTGLV